MSEKLSMLEKIMASLPDEKFIVIDGHDDAIIGVAEEPSGYRLIYKLSLIFNGLVRDHGFESHTDCYEWYEFNMFSLSNMENGPIFMDDLLLEF